VRGRRGDVRAEASHHRGRARPRIAPAPQAHDVLRSRRKRRRSGAWGRIRGDTRRHIGDDQRDDLIGDLLHRNDVHHDDSLFNLVRFEHRVVGALHGVGQLR